jgi:hypothetical protein
MGGTHAQERKREDEEDRAWERRLVDAAGERAAEIEEGHRGIPEGLRGTSGALTMAMNHPCMSNFWGTSWGEVPPPPGSYAATAIDIMLAWLDFLDSISPASGVHAARTLTPQTWQTLCLMQWEIERAAGYDHVAPAAWMGGGTVTDSDEADIRAISQVFLALLVADQFDDAHPFPHTHSTSNWIKGGPPELAGITRLVGTQYPVPPDAASLLGRIRNSLGS